MATAVSSWDAGTQRGHAGDVAWLIDATRMLTGCTSERDLIVAGCRLIVARMHPREIAIALVQPAAGRIEVVARLRAEVAALAADAGQSFEPDSPIRSLLYGRDLGPTGPGWYFGKVPDPIHPWPFAGTLRQSLWLSLRVGPEVVGCIAICLSRRGDRRPRDAEMMTLFAGILALRLQALRLQSERDDRLFEIDAGLRQLTIEQAWLREASTAIAACRTVQDVTNATYRAVRYGLAFDRVGIFLVQDVHGQRWLRLLAGTAANGEETGEESILGLDHPDFARAVPDVAHLLAGAPYFYSTDRWSMSGPDARLLMDGQTREQLVVAIRRGNDLLGTIAIDNLLTERPLPEARAEVLVTFAQLVATALENARLIEAEAQARGRAEALLRASQAMHGSMNTREVMQVVARETRQALQSVTCDIYLYDEAMQRTIDFFTDGYDQDEILAHFDYGVLSLPPLEVDSEREMLATLKPVLIDTVETPPDSTSLSTHLGYTARLLVPLLTEQSGLLSVRGAMYVNYVGRNVVDISREEIDLACGMAAQAAGALVKAGLYEFERDRARRLEEVDTLRREFLATVSHELRTPLTGIIGFAETLVHFWDQLPEDRRLNSVRRMVISAQRLDRLVRDLLLASRLEDAHFSLQIEPVEARPRILHAVEEIRAKYTGQIVAVQLPEHEVLVSADGERLAQVLVNLVDNAVKYSPEASPVEVGLDITGPAARFWVRDAGPGITESQMVRLFERFGKLGHIPRAGLGGTGLGLYICRHLVRAMGGEISVETEPGRGSTFSFNLPLAAAPVPPS